MSRPPTFTFHLRGATQHTPGDAEILDAIQAYLKESGEIPACSRAEALGWALNRFKSEGSPVFVSGCMYKHGHMLRTIATHMSGSTAGKKVENRGLQTRCHLRLE